MSNYVEPKTPQEILTLEEARGRIVELEAALLVFANIGIIMGSAAFNLAANGREGEPAGGYWINGLDHSVMKQGDHLFFKALYAYGRGRGEAEYCAAMEKLRQDQEDSGKLTALPAASQTPS